MMMTGLRQWQQGGRQSAEREALLSAPDWVWKGGKREALRVVLLWAAGWMVVPFNKVQAGRRSRFGVVRRMVTAHYAGFRTLALSCRDVRWAGGVCGSSREKRLWKWMYCPGNMCTMGRLQVAP